MTSAKLNTNFLDPAVFAGHGVQTDGSFDCGCTYKRNGIVHTEADHALKVTKWAVRYLRGIGFKVITDAFDGNNINMIVQVEKANSAKVDIFISIHLDYYKAPSGVMPLYASIFGKRLAKCIEKRLTGIGMNSRGICERSDLYELNATDAVANIVEIGSIKADLDYIIEHPRKIGKAIAKGICDYAGVDWIYTIYNAKCNTKARYKASKTGKVRKSVKKGANVAIFKLSKSGKWGYSPYYGWINLDDLERG